MQGLQEWRHAGVGGGVTFMATKGMRVLKFESNKCMGVFIDLHYAVCILGFSIGL